MRKVVLCVIFFIATACENHEVSFVSIINKENATKEGVYVNNFVVHIRYDSILMLDKKEVKITGNYVTVLGLKSNDSLLRQGRNDATRHILNPKIEIIE